MKRLAVLSGLVLVTALLAGVLSFSAILNGAVRPPVGTLRLGPLTVMSLPPCPTIPGNLFGPGRRCGSASPWAVWAIVRLPGGERKQWHLLSVVVDPASKVP